MKKWLARWKRAYLKFRINSAQADLILSSERHTQYADAMAGIEQWQREQQLRLRMMRAEFALLESPEKLLADALKGGGH